MAKVFNFGKNIKREHVKRALDYVMEKGKEGKYGILYIKYRAKNRGLKYNGRLLAPREVRRAALLCCLKDCGFLEGEPLNTLDMKKSIMEIKESHNLEIKMPSTAKELLISENWNIKKEDFVKFEKDRTIVDKTNDDGEEEDAETDDKACKLACELLKQFHQIIFTGPPGTGKTRRAMKILPELLKVEGKDIDVNQGKRWDIVQFHPSYNYEDFVRGVKVKTTKDNNVEYKTENRIFGDMCLRAKKDSRNNYVLIIDEINRANVSAVLGELIYALEYREEKIRTPYAVDDKKEGEKGGENKDNEKDMLVIPNNLYIIGTMNTADRTIGQIDYAVRRRFAFMSCFPDENVIVSNAAGDIFERVENIFNNYISPDYDADDVRIGHSYFIHDEKKENISPIEQISLKIRYQVVPILREYIKDGVLLKDAENEISEIKEMAKELLDDESNEEQGKPPKGVSFYCWEKEGRFGINILGRTVLSIVKDYAEDKKTTIKELKDWFPDKGKNSVSRGIKLEKEIIPKYKGRFFMKEGIEIDGKIVYVTREWGRAKSDIPDSFERFREVIKESGYTILDCHSIRTDKEIMEGKSEKKFSNSDEIEGIEPSHIVFAFHSEEDSFGRRGRYVGMGRVLEKNLKEAILHINWEKVFSWEEAVDGRWGATTTPLQNSLNDIEKKLKGK